VALASHWLASSPNARRASPAKPLDKQSKQPSAVAARLRPPPTREGST